MTDKQKIGQGRAKRVKPIVYYTGQRLKITTETGLDVLNQKVEHTFIRLSSTENKNKASN